MGMTKIIRSYSLDKGTVERLQRLAKENKLSQSSIIIESVKYLDWILKTRNGIKLAK